MPEITIQKSEMKKILHAISHDYTLVAPVVINEAKKVVDFAKVNHDAEVLMGDEIAYKSPKEFFFPRSEKIIEFTKETASIPENHEKIVLFGVRPCDLEALKVMKAVFTGGKFSDPFFQTHIDNNVIIGVGCQNEKVGCFCSERDTDKAYSSECDLFLENCGDSYKVLYVSQKGVDSLSKYIKGLEVTEPREKKVSESLDLNAETEEVFDKIDWASVSETCQGCGMCTFICPTCHCFGFKDVEEHGVASRFRRWDSCMYSKFTLHASGHNPRESKKERFRQRVLHKYLYVKKNTGYVACSGCGRCVRSCPAGMNIRKVVEGIREEIK